MGNAATAAVICAVIASAACAISALASWFAWKWAKTVRSTISMQGELAEIRDYLQKMDRWAKRINAREVMAERRAEASEPAQKRSLRAVSGVTEKDELRRRAGLVAGQPARHQGE